MHKGAVSAAVRRLDQHHGSSAGKMSASKPDWLCKACKGADGKPYRNLGFRSQCRLCSIAKGSCFGANVVATQPTQRTLAAKQVAAQKLAEKKHKGNDVEKQLKKQLAELKKENEKLGAKLESFGCPDQTSETDSKELGFKEKLGILEEKRQFFSKHGMAEELAKVLAEVREVKASKDASIPEGQQLKRAEQELAKRHKQSLAIEASLAEAKQRVDELEKKKLEADEKRAEAEKELEKVKTRISVPASKPKAGTFSWAQISAGHLDFFKVQSPAVLEQHGLGISEQQQLQDLLSRAARVQEVAMEERARVEAATANPVGSGAAASDHAHASGQQPVHAHAVAAKAAIVDDDVLMGLCEGSNSELAQAAKLIMESDVIAKRRKLANT